jgi:hypothetical protein
MDWQNNGSLRSFCVCKVHGCERVSRLDLISAASFGKECLKYIDLRTAVIVCVSGSCNNTHWTYIAMAIIARLAKKAYQKRRLRGRQ